MVIPARRFKIHEMAIQDLEGTKNKQTSRRLNVQDRMFYAEDLSFKKAFKKLCDKKVQGEVYLISGIKLDGYFCDYDDKVIVLQSPDGINKINKWYIIMRLLHCVLNNKLNNKFKNKVDFKF